MIEVEHLYEHVPDTDARQRAADMLFELKPDQPMRAPAARS